MLLAQAIPLNKYISELKNLSLSNVEEIIEQIKRQHYSNLFYLPSIGAKGEYIVPLDFISQISIEELDMLKSDFNNNRIAILDQFGFYLFMFKLSFHFCRLPETQYRL